MLQNVSFSLKNCENHLGAGAPDHHLASGRWGFRLQKPRLNFY